MYAYLPQVIVAFNYPSYPWLYNLAVRQPPFIIFIPSVDMLISLVYSWNFWFSRFLVLQGSGICIVILVVLEVSRPTNIISVVCIRPDFEFREWINSNKLRENNYK